MPTAHERAYPSAQLTASPPHAQYAIQETTLRALSIVAKRRVSADVFAGKIHHACMLRLLESTTEMLAGDVPCTWELSMRQSASGPHAHTRPGLAPQSPANFIH